MSSESLILIDTRRLESAAIPKESARKVVPEGSRAHTLLTPLASVGGIMWNRPTCIHAESASYG